MPNKRTIEERMSASQTPVSPSVESTKETKRKRLPEKNSGFDHEIQSALEFDPDLVQLKNQVISLINQSSKYTDEHVRSSCDEQIEFAQENLIKKLQQEFGETRTKPYIEKLKMGGKVY
eukprot:UN29736